MMGKIIGGYIAVFVLIILAMYVTALFTILFVVGVVFASQAYNPVIKHIRLQPVIMYSVGWGIFATLFLIFSTMMVSGLVYNSELLETSALWVDATEFGIILAISVFLGNRFATIPKIHYLRKYKVLLPPVLLIIGICITLFFDILLRKQSFAFNLPTISQLSAYKYIDVLLSTISNIPNDIIYIFKSSYIAYADSGGSAFVLKPFSSIAYVVWFLIGIVLTTVFRGREKNYETPTPNDDSSLAVFYRFGLWNIGGLAMSFTGMGVANWTMNTYSATPEGIGAQLAEFLIIAVLMIISIICMLGGLLVVLLTPFLWITAFLIASSTPSPNFIKHMKNNV